jgi:hypothetical protein
MDNFSLLRDQQVPGRKDTLLSTFDIDRLRGSRI